MISISLQLLFFLYLTRQQDLVYECLNGGEGPCNPDLSCPGTQSCIVTITAGVRGTYAVNTIRAPTTPGTPSPSSPETPSSPGTASSPGTPSSPGTVATATTPSTATVTPPCVDLPNPRTGISDCPRLQYLCTNALYWTLMTEQCPKTCNRCNGAGTPPSSTCQDLVDYRTGVSNCAQVASYCTNAVYLELMRIQCPKTCGYCV